MPWGGGRFVCKCIVAILFKLQLFYNLLFHEQMCVREEERIIMLNKKTIGAFVAAATLLSGFTFAALAPVAFANDGTGDTNQTEHSDNDVIFADEAFWLRAKKSMRIPPYGNGITVKQARDYNSYLDLGLLALSSVAVMQGGTPSIVGPHRGIVSKLDALKYFPNVTSIELLGNEVSDFSPLAKLKHLNSLYLNINESKAANAKLPYIENLKKLDLSGNDIFIKKGYKLSLIHISEPTRPCLSSRMPSSA